MRGEILSQSLDGEVGIHHPHHGADGEEQNHYFDGVVDEEIERGTKMRSSIESHHYIRQPVGKVLYHILVIGDALFATAAAWQGFLLNFGYIESGKHIFYLIANAPKHCHNLLVGACGSCRVVETEVKALAHIARKCRTTLFGSATHGYHIIPLHGQIFVHIARTSIAYVDAYLSHCLYGIGIDCRGGMCASRAYFDVGAERLQISHCHLAAATIACA